MKKTKLIDVCCPKQWKTISTEKLLDAGYPVYGANGKIGFYDEYNHEAETLMITCRGATCGSVCISEPFSYINGNAMCLDKLAKTVNLRYLYYFLRNYDFKNVISGSAQPQITIQGLQQVVVHLYDLPTQQKIVEELDCLSNIIEKKKKQLSDFDELIKSKFVEMFGSAPSKKIEDVCSSFKIGPFGSALHKNEIAKEGFAFVLGTDNAVKNEFSFDEIRYIDKDKYQQLESYVVKPGDIIMSMMGTVGRVAIIPDNLGVAVISSHLCILRVNKQYIYPEFFHVAFCKDENIQHQISDIHNGSIMKGFNLKIVKAFKIKCPSLEEQLKFLSFKKLIDKAKLEVQQSIDETQNLFNERMQHYFGE